MVRDHDLWIGFMSRHLSSLQNDSNSQLKMIFLFGGGVENLVP